MSALPLQLAGWMLVAEHRADWRTAGQQMQVTSLVRIYPASPAPRAALRALLEAARTLRSLPGFRMWQTFRAMDASDALLIVIDWDSTAALTEALCEPQLLLWQAQAAARGFRVGTVEILPATFDRQLTVRCGVVSLLRLSDREAAPQDSPVRDSDFALQALAAPGSTRLHGAASQNGDTAICRIDFDTEDGVWHFLDSPLRAAWSGQARGARIRETWAINLPRLEFEGGAHLPRAFRVLQANRSALSVQLSISDDWHYASVRLQGHMDARGGARCEKLCRSLMGEACQVLELDVSGLAGISPSAVEILTRIARSVKESGGRFVLVDNAQRVRRVTRTKHLEASLR